MKRVLVGLLSLSLLASCGKKEESETPVVDTTPAVTPEAMAKTGDLPGDSHLLAESLERGDYQAAIALFDSNLASALSEESLTSAWLATVEPLGAYSGQMDVAVEGDISVVTMYYERESLVITLVFDDDFKVAGLHLTYAEGEVAGQEGEESGDSGATLHFLEEEWTITTQDHLPLGGTLTLPEGVENPPVVLLIQGSGALDRNSSISANAPFQELASGLAAEGIASLRYDRRFYTYPEEASVLAGNMTLEEEILADVDTALAMLAGDERLGSIYLLGHSLGGMLCPGIAWEHSEVAGIISLAGSPLPLYEISYRQNLELLNLTMEAETDATSLALLKMQLDKVEKDIVTLRGDLSELSRSSILLGMPVAYQQSVKDNAGELFLSGLSIPVLVLQGEEDVQISPTVDYPLLEEALAGNALAEFHLYPGLNHLMMESSGAGTGDYDLKGTVDAQVMADITGFILGQ